MWSNEVVFKLIELYRSYECLWDANNDGYKNKIKKNQTWEEMALVMDMPRREVEMKIHSLRSQFIRERKKIKTAMETGVVPRPSTWFAYNSLMFLVKEEFSVDTILKHDMNQDSQSTNDSELENNQVLDSSINEMENTHSDLSTELANRTKNTRKRVNEEGINNRFNNTTETKKRMDEFDIYAQYIASELRHVNSEHGAIMAKYYINNIILDARMGKFDKDAPAYSRGVASPSRMPYNDGNTRVSKTRRTETNSDVADTLVMGVKCEHDEDR